MRGLLLVLSCWWCISWMPLSSPPASSSASAMPRQEAITTRMIWEAAQAHGIPPVALLAIWKQECQLRAVCRKGDGGRSYGPFQVQAIAARHHGCIGDTWKAGSGNVDCAARILGEYYRATGRWTTAFTRYNWPQYPYKGPSAYGWSVYHIMLGMEMQARHGAS